MDNSDEKTFYKPENNLAQAKIPPAIRKFILATGLIHKLMFGGTQNQHGTRRVADNTFHSAAQQHVGQAGMTMGSD